MTASTPSHPSKPTAAPPRVVPIRTVPRAAVEALVARLVAAGVVPVPRLSEMP